MGNGIAVILLHINPTKFDKQLSTRGISRTAYLGRLIHTVSNMIDIVLIEDSSEDDDRSVFDEDKRNDGSDRQSMVGKSESEVSNIMSKSDEFGGLGSEFESSDYSVVERSRDIRNRLEEGVDRANCGHKSSLRVQKMYVEFESSSCQVIKRCKEERNGCDTQGVGKSEDTTRSGDSSGRFSNSEPESSDYQMEEEYHTGDEMDTNKDESHTDEADSMTRMYC